MTVDALIGELLAIEGGYTADPRDHGNYTSRGALVGTKYGISARAYEAWLGHPPTAEEMAALSVDVARSIYTHLYIEVPGFDRIDYAPLQAELVDFGVNSGPAMAIEFLQRALGVEPDGVLGVLTRMALVTADRRTITNRIAKARLQHFAQLAATHHDQQAFLPGWVVRYAEFIDT